MGPAAWLGCYALQCTALPVIPCDAASGPAHRTWHASLDSRPQPRLSGRVGSWQIMNVVASWELS